jgi:D-alanyl-D-alanine carboxypeptidase (penicillin-binding protein 5/6)
MRPRARLIVILAAMVAAICVFAGPLAAVGAAQSTAKGPATSSRSVLDAIGGPLMADHSTVVHYPAGHPRLLPSVPASAWVIANASTGQVLAARDPHGQFGPASTLKVLTAITLIPRLNPDAMVTASQLAASVEPNIVGLIPGHKYQVADLFRALLLISANDAAVALTQATGSFSRGMALINAEAHHLQAYDVVAKQPNGLPAAGQVVSAYDEALIARQALATPAFMKYDSTLATRFEVKPGHFETLLNQNYLLTKYPGGIGGKIGWTVSSEATYIGMARRHGVTLIVTILHCTPLQEITSAEKLLNWGFAMNGKVQPVGTLVSPLATTAHPAMAAAGKSDARSGSGARVPNGAKTGAAALADQAVAGEHAGGSGVPVYALAGGAVALAGLAAGGLLLTRRKLAAARK